MKKNIILLLILSIYIGACEKDDICLSPNTPKLVLRFYDNADTTALKEAKLLSVWAEEKDTLSAYKSVSTDSISIPLNTNASETVYNLKINSATENKTGNKHSKLTIKYTTEDIYVSRSCGYKTIFNDVTITSDSSWIKSFTPSTLTTINNEASAHIKIFH